MPKSGSLHAAGKPEGHIGKGIFSRLTSTVYPHFFYRLPSTVFPPLRDLSLQFPRLKGVEKHTRNPR